MRLPLRLLPLLAALFAPMALAEHAPPETFGITLPDGKPPALGKEPKSVAIHYRVVPAADYEKTLKSMTEEMAKDPLPSDLPGSVTLDMAAGGWNWMRNQKCSAYISGLREDPDTHETKPTCACAPSGVVLLADDRQGNCKLTFGSIQLAAPIEQTQVFRDGKFLGIVETPKTTDERLVVVPGDRWTLAKTDRTEDHGAGLRVILFAKRVDAKR